MKCHSKSKAAISMLTEMLVLILYGWYNVFANLRWHRHAIPLYSVTLFPGNGGFLLKSNFVQLSPKNRHLMKQECMVSNEHEAARSYTEDLILKDFMEQTHSLISRAVHTISRNPCATFIYISFFLIRSDSDVFPQHQSRKVSGYVIFLGKNWQFLVSAVSAWLHTVFPKMFIMYA